MQTAFQVPHQRRRSSRSGHSSDSRWLGIVTIMLLLLTACGPAPEPASAAATSAAASLDVPPRVEADGETLEGAYYGSDGRQVVFRGMPYAAPPVGGHLLAAQGQSGEGL